MSLVQFFRILWARRIVLIVALASAFFAGLVMIQVLPKRYSAHARVMLDVVKPDPVTGQVLGTQFLRSYTKTQIELIKDFQTAGEVVDRLGWASNPEIASSYYAQNPGGDAEGLRRWLANQIISGTEANLIEASNILEITFSGPNPETAKRIVTVIREVYLEDSLESKREGAGRNADWFREQAAQSEALVKAAEADRARFAAENGIVLQADNTDLESSRLNALSQQSASASAATPVTITGLGGGGVSATQVQLDTVTQQLAQASNSLGPNHPTYQALQRQRTVLEKAAAQERAAAAPARGATGPDPAARANAAYEAQKRKVVSQSAAIDMLGRMTRDIELKREQLAKLNDRANESRLSANVVDTGMSPLGDAITTGTPEFPKVPLVLGGSIGFGGALGVVLALLIELLGRRVRSHEDLEGAIAAPVFAEIGAKPKKVGFVRKLIGKLGERSRRRELVPLGAE
jgi:polysaccharide biosynthesis transport protein